ncbi:hypothetical protein E1B28_005089 [Marasmius oreades]|uniref:Uncharacterized protein n=1 Tax=Marasmius oreades TaxID=181124 RepID=A0A9P8ADM6_9AGAR|nr:uncharacterized protein E1B28_005089 [Marasmius oreades]KAG7097769.1 hypothetical protein E1B28_005089 [Marasmius oreades]
MLQAAGRDPVEVFKGLQTDEDFHMAPSQVKALAEVLASPGGFTKANEGEEARTGDGSSEEEESESYEGSSDSSSSSVAASPTVAESL